MTVQRRFRVLLVVVLTALVSPACYTLLKHPQVKWDTVYEDVQDRQCTNCHYEDEVWSYHHPANRRYYAGDHYSNWEYYYEVPWWYESYWYYTPPTTKTVPLPSRSLRPGEGTDLPSTTGGTVSHPPGMKSQGSSVRTTTTDERKKGETNEKKSKDRTVRPKGKKEKGDG